MASKPKKKMPASQRAKQFLPFAAVQGLDIALAKKEEEVTSTSSSKHKTSQDKTSSRIK